MAWLNPPPDWRQDDDTLIVTSAPNTDFWRKTADDGQRDSGHFLAGEPLAGDFAVEVGVRGEYAAIYDQAGLMVRHDGLNWVKCGIELVEGVQYASAVVTRETSDWSVVPLRPSPASLQLRVTRRGGTLEVHYKLFGGTFTLLRQLYFPLDPVTVGPMLASPKGPGFTATFTGLRVIQ